VKYDPLRIAPDSALLLDETVFHGVTFFEKPLSAYVNVVVVDIVVDKIG